MLWFPVIAFAIGLIALSRVPASEFFDMDRPRDRIARHVLLALGILILIAWVF
jgi:hypothetical protein